MYSPQFSRLSSHKNLLYASLRFLMASLTSSSNQLRENLAPVILSPTECSNELFHCGTGAAGGPTMAGALFHLTSSRIEVRKARGQTLLVLVCSAGSLSSLICFGRLRDHQLQSKPPSGLLAPSSPWRFPRAEIIQLQHMVILSLIHI